MGLEFVMSESWYISVGKTSQIRSILSSQVYAQKETCSEELDVERLVRKGLQQVVLSVQSKDGSRIYPELQLIWGITLYHLDDIPFTPSTIPDVYTQFRKASFAISYDFILFKDRKELLA